MSESTGEKDGQNGLVHKETDGNSESSTPSPTTPAAYMETSTANKQIPTASSHHQHSHQKAQQTRPHSSTSSAIRAPKNGNGTTNSTRPKSGKVRKGPQKDAVGPPVNNDAAEHSSTIHNSKSVPRSSGIKSHQSSSSNGREGDEDGTEQHVTTQEPGASVSGKNKTSSDATGSARHGETGSSSSRPSNFAPTSDPLTTTTGSERTKLSPVPSTGKNKKPGGEKPSRQGLASLTGIPYESGVNTECIQLLRQLWNVHEEAVQFLGQIRSALTHFRQELRAQENHFESNLREKRHSNAASTTGPLAGAVISSGGGSGERGGNEDMVRIDGWVPLQMFIDGLKCISDSFSDIEKQFGTLSVFKTQCKLTLFAKVKHAKLQVTHDRLSIMHGIQQLITVALNLLASPSSWCVTEEGKVAKLVQNVFQLTEVYNSVLESSWSIATTSESTEAASNTSSLVDMEAGTTNAPSNKKSAITSIQVLVQINAANRNDSPLLKLSMKPLNGMRLLQILAEKRSTFAAHAFYKTMLSTFFTNPSEMLTPGKFESCYSEEDSGLRPLGKAFSHCPSLLGHAAVKKTENGEQRLCRSTRTKMYSYFHQVLWTLAGEHAEDLLLWGTFYNLPMVLQPLEAFSTLRNALSLGQHLQESNLSPMLSAFDSVSGALHSFSLLANWDEKMREAFQEMYQVKRPEHISLVSKPEPSQWATEIGSKFGQIITSCVSMIDSGSGYNTGRFSAPANEEEPLGNEAQIFFRLEASLVYFKAWVVKRSKVWLNGWAIPQFLAISQREPALLVKLIKSRESLLITRDFLLNHEDISIRLSAKHRKACADDLRVAILMVQTMPDELLQTVGPVCRTLSLATLQSYMPPASHWKSSGFGTGHGPDKPSNYVSIFIGRVVEPVTTASVELIPGPVQEAMGKQIVHAACDAWLQYILHKKLKFSEWGAVQLLRDFTAFREWIRTETELEKEARKAILHLEVLKTCEGVAYLLLRNPGDVLGVGKKPSRQNRRVAPTSSDSVTSSPDRDADSTAEDDIPAEMYVPNQQMWLELRLRRSYFTPPCC